MCSIVIEIYGERDRWRLGEYGSQKVPVPIEGFWSSEQIQEAFPR